MISIELTKLKDGVDEDVLREILKDPDVILTLGRKRLLGYYFDHRLRQDIKLYKEAYYSIKARRMFVRMQANNKTWHASSGDGSWEEMFEGSDVFRARFVPREPTDIDLKKVYEAD